MRPETCCTSTLRLRLSCIAKRAIGLFLNRNALNGIFMTSMTATIG
jgi:hypothetical protein